LIYKVFSGYIEFSHDRVYRSVSIYSQPYHAISRFGGELHWEVERELRYSQLRDRVYIFA